MLFTVDSFQGNIRFVSTEIRSEDIKMIYEDPLDEDKSIIEFYDDEDPIKINENFILLSKRHEAIENEEFYSTTKENNREKETN